MALSTYSKFYYGWKVTNLNRYIDFNDGSVKLATLAIGSYTAQELCNEVVKQMNAVSSLDFVCTFNRTTRRFTISSASSFSLLFGTGVHAAISPAPLMGYTNTDKTSATSHLSEGPGGYAFNPQFIIQSYRPTTNNRKSIDGVINKSANGTIEVVKFGDERFMSGELLFITNIIQNDISIIRTNTTGVEDYIQFIEFATEKNTIEFMPDESKLDVYQALLLESTESDTKGLDYDLIEMYDRGLAEYFRSGKLTFKLLE